MVFKLPYLIVGAGIVGLQVAYRLFKEGVHPDEIALFEQNIYPGEHSSSRNSGVLHAGLYYHAQSLKQKFCLRGNQMWDGIARELGISLNRCGKWVVACKESEIEELEKLFSFAKEKGVLGLSYKKANEIEDYVHVKKAFFSASTGVLNVSEAIQKHCDFLHKVNIPLLLDQKVELLERSTTGFAFKVGKDEMEAGRIINCGGLFGVNLRKQLGLQDIEDVWVKGRYLKLHKPYYHRSLIYPLPPADLKGLGVHTSFDGDGQVRFGPDVLQGHLEAIDYEVEENSLDQIFPAVNKIFRGVKKEDLGFDYSGIRTKIKKEGELYYDFLVQSPLPHYYECLGIESPGLTSAPSIAEYLVGLLLKS